MKKIYIIGGTGNMGRFLSSFLLASGISVESSGREFDKKKLATSDLVFISVPISYSSPVIKKVSEIVSKNSLIIDLSSVMKYAQDAFVKIPQLGISMHFLFNPNLASIANQTVVIQKSKRLDKIAFLVKLLEKAGAQLIYMEADEHDKQMAKTQNLVHFINISLGKILQNGKSPLITPVFLAQISAAHRVLTQDAELLTEIQKNNPYGIQTIEKYLSYTKTLLEKIKTETPSSLAQNIKHVQKGYIPLKIHSMESDKNFEINIPKSASIAYLGPDGTYSSMAAKQIKAAKYMALDSLEEVFKSVEKSKADFGIVPAQNTIHGAIRETFDMLGLLNIKTAGSVYLPIHHAIVSHEKSMSDIKNVYSHPQALAQCKNFLEKNLKKAKVIPTDSTLSAVSHHKNEVGAGFIVPVEARLDKKLHVLSENIEDYKNNTTRFFIITKKDYQVLYKNPKTILLLSIYNRVGVLRDILTVFANENINLSNIESRPSMDKNWDYNFFVELDIPQEDPKLTEALNILKQYCPEIKILGGVS